MLPVISRRFFACAGLGTLACIVALGQSWRPSRREDAAGGKLAVEFAGCQTLLATSEGLVCELPSGSPLHLWVDALSGLTVTSGIGAKVEEQRTAAGASLSVIPGLWASEVTVRLNAKVQHGSWRLSLRRPAAVSWLDLAGQWKDQGHFEKSDELLRQHLARRLPPRVRAQATGLLARVQLRQGRTAEARDLFRQALQLDHEAGLISDEINHAAGLAYLMMYEDGQDYRGARKLIEERASLIAEYGEGRVRAAYYLGSLSYAIGDLRTALYKLEEAHDWAERLHVTEELRLIPAIQATVLQELGRGAEAAAIFSGLLTDPEPRPACDQASLLEGLGWSLGLAQEDHDEGDMDGKDPMGPSMVDLLKEALLLYRSDCHQPEADYGRILGMMALGAVRQGDLDDAQKWLAEARALVPHVPPYQNLEWLDVQGRLARKLGRNHDALSSYQRMAGEAERIDALPYRWQALLGRGDALEALNRPDEALSAYREAEDVLSDRRFAIPLCLARTVPLAESGPENGRCIGAGTFVDNHERGTRLYVDLLLRLHQPREALRVVRKAQLRGLLAAQLGQQLVHLDEKERDQWNSTLDSYREEREKFDRAVADEWKIPRENLEAERMAQKGIRQAALKRLDQALLILDRRDRTDREPGPLPAGGELLFTCYPVRRGWSCFAADEDQVSAGQLGLLPPGRLQQANRMDLANRLLDPFRDRLGTATRLRILPYGRMRDVDFAALPWDEQTALVQHVPVVYGSAGLAHSLGEGGNPAAGHALLVIDPKGDLRNARAVGADAVSALQGRAWQVERLEGLPHHGGMLGTDPPGLPATWAAVHEGLSQCDLFHYQGHNDDRESLIGESTLATSGTPLGTPVTAGDVLALPRVPRWVVLIGCQTAEPGGTQQGESLGLVQAFVLRGSGAVIATVRRIDDTLGASMARALYRNGLAERHPDLATTLQRAQQELIRDAPGSDWSAFRVYVP